MLINSITCRNNLQNNPTPTNFKQGLTRDIVNHVKNMPSDEYKRITERLQNKYGMRADVGGSNTVAFCVEQTANIMDKAGFSLIKLFSFEKLKGDVLGEYFYNDKIITINSSYSEFLDLEKMEQLEEDNNNYNDSRYFLDTYLHEFLHAGHHKNIIKNYGKNKGNNSYYELESYAPYYNLRQQLLKFIKNIFPKMTNEQRENIFPEKLRLHKSGNLVEYFAEKNASKLEAQLGDDFNIDNVVQNMAQNYKGFPEGWSIDDEVIKIINSAKPDERVKNTLNDILNCFEGEIWNGNLVEIKKKSHAFRDYGKKYANK